MYYVEKRKKIAVQFCLLMNVMFGDREERITITMIWVIWLIDSKDHSLKWPSTGWKLILYLYYFFCIDDMNYPDF